jgi:hypothetical protein
MIPLSQVLQPDSKEKFLEFLFANADSQTHRMVEQQHDHVFDPHKGDKRAKGEIAPLSRDPRVVTELANFIEKDKRNRSN